MRNLEDETNCEGGEGRRRRPLPLLAELRRLSMTLRLSSSGYDSECRRWKEKKKTAKDR